MSKIELELTEKSFISSSSVTNALLAALSTWDATYTYGPRYFKLISDVYNKNDQGLIIEFTSQNLWAALGLTIVYVGLGVYYIYKEVKQQAKEYEDFCSHQKMIKQFHEQPEALIEAGKVKTLTKEDIQLIKDLKAFIEKQEEDRALYIKQALEADKNLSEMYESIEVDEGDQKIFLTLRKDKPKTHILKKGLKLLGRKLGPIYDMFSLASFVYWILWIGAAIFTRTFADNGIAGLNPWVAFGLPGLIGLIPLGIKIVRFCIDRYRRKKKPGYIDKGSQVTQATLDTNAILQRVKDRREAEFHNIIMIAEINKYRVLNGKPKLTPNLKQGFDETDQLDFHPTNLHTIGTRKKTRMFLNFMTKTVSMYVAVQYISWILVDFFQVGLNIGLGASVAMGFGWVLMGVSLLAGLFQIWQAHETAKADKQRLDNLKTKPGLESQQEKMKKELLEKKEKMQSLEIRLGHLRMTKETDTQDLPLSPYLAKKMDEIYQHEGIQTKRPLSWWGRVKEDSFRVFDRGMTGIFFTRIFTVKNSAIFLPFGILGIVFPQAVLALIVAAGILYASLAMYQYYLEKHQVEARKCGLKGTTDYLKLKGLNESADICLDSLEEQAAYYKTLPDKAAPTPTKSSPLASPRSQNSPRFSFIKSPLLHQRKVSPEEPALKTGSYGR